VLTRRVLNRTLLRRQHLLARATLPALSMTEHLLGLQAQDPLPPYLSLHARLDGFEPAEISTALQGRTAVRVLLMRGTIHLVTPRDALLLRPFVQPMLDKVTRTSATSNPAAGADRGELAAAARAAFAAGPITLKALGALLQQRFPGYPAGALANSVREMMPLVQIPPRGLWRQPGGVVYENLHTWLGIDASEPADVHELVRRYLRAYGPASPADATAWSRVTGLRAAFDAIRDELVSHRDEDGRELFDLEGLPLADGDTPAPVRLLGKYDNLWLSHAARDRVTPDPAKRRRWMGANGGVASTVFVDGALEGLWRQTPSGALDVEPFRRLTRVERDELDVEVARVEELLAR
jgi:hypothetical protein